jgi:glyoxylase-like metal-dependent hydrolase (beta-lactamase superfamily II)
MRVLSWRVPPYDNGTYVIVDDRRDAVVIDPAMGERQVIDAVKEQGLRLVEILNTHGHADHIYGNAAVKEATKARLAIHRLDEYRLGPTRPPTPMPIPPCDADDLFDEGPLAYVADLEVRALHTPGHTEGSTCFYIAREDVLFSGDVLFKGNTGRWDLPGGDRDQMERSLERVMTLPPNTKVYPGHGAPTTIGAEMPTLRQLREAGTLPGLQV